MRSYGMYDMSRGLTLGFAAGLAGLALWGASQIGTQTQGHFWIAMVIVAAAGLVLALASHVGMWAKGLRLRLSPSTLVFAFLPVLVCVGWILLASQPGAGWQEGRIQSWSSTMGILGAVHALGLWAGALAFGFGLVLGLSFDSVPVAAAEAAPAYAAPRGMPADGAADEPVAAERRDAARRGSGTSPAAPAEETTQTQERIPAR
jgi:hypothetical protein